MPKHSYKYLRDISRRHFNRLIKKRSILKSPSTFKVTNEDSPIDNVLDSTVSNIFPIKEFQNYEHEMSEGNIGCESDVSSCDSVSQKSNKNVEWEIDTSSENECLNCTSEDGNSVSSVSCVEDEENFESESDNNVSNEGIPDNQGKCVVPETNCSSDYVSKLANWAVNYQIKNNALNDLLKIQSSEPGYASLPKDSRTLLHTPRSSIIRIVEPGEYFHYGVKNVLQEYLSSIGKSKPHTVEMFVGIDGLPISNSNKSQVWPILCFFKNNVDSKKSKVYTIGMYHGYEKPYCSNDFLKDFTTEMKPLLLSGFKYNNSNLVTNITLSALICDAPAKSFVLKTKGHTGFYSCSRCCQKGETLHGRTCFPEKNSENRTHESFLNQNQPEYHSGTTSLTGLPNFDLVRCVPLEYMHLICLGVVKKLLLMWIFVVKGRHRLPLHIIQPMSDNLNSLCQYIPKEFARKPRSIFESNRWKATELRQFLLYTGPLVLQSKLSKEKYLHFLVLSVAISIMLSKKYHAKLLAYAHSLLEYFVDNFSIIYGKQYISHNVHALIHLEDDVTRYGALDNCSAFPFESFMYTLKKFLVRKPEKPLQQFARRQFEYLTSHTTSEVEKESTIVLKKLHIEGPLAGRVSGDQYKEIVSQGYVFNTSKGNNCCKLEDGSIVLISNFVKNNHSVTIIGKKFNTVTDFFIEPCKSSTLDIVFVSNLSELKVWNFSCGVTKCILLPYSDGFVVYPFLHEKY